MKNKIACIVLALTAGFFIMAHPTYGQEEFLFELYSTAVLYPEEADQFAASHRKQLDESFFTCTQYLKEDFRRMDQEFQENCKHKNGRNAKRHQQCIEDNYAAGVADVIADLERLARGTPWLKTTSGQQAMTLANLQQGQYHEGYSDYYPAIATIYGRRTADKLMWRYEREVFQSIVERLEAIRPHFDCVRPSVP